MEKHTLDSYVEVLTHTKRITENMHEAIAGYTKMAQMLEAAVDGLESTASRVQQEVACMLSSFIQEAEQMVNCYTDVSWAQYMAALAQAKNVQHERKSRLVELLKVKNELRDAKCELVYDKNKKKM